MQKSKANIFLWSVVAFVGISMTGCLKSTEPQPQAAQAYISILHLGTMPPAPAVEIYFNTKKVSDPFNAGGVSATYSPVEKGDFSVSFKKSGGDSLIAYIPEDRYDSLGFYSIMLYNQPNGSVNAMRVEDDFSDLTLDKPFFRFWHASPSISDGGPVDLYIDNNKVSSQRVLADNEFSDYYNVFTASTTGYHNLQIKRSSNDTVIVSANDVNLLAGNAYTIFLRGNLGGAAGSANELKLGVLRAAN